MDRSDSKVRHATVSEIEQFRRHELDPVALVAFSDHLAACSECRNRVSSSDDRHESLLDGLDQLVDHVPEEELQAYVRRSLSSDRVREIDRHLRNCRSCATELRDLQDFASVYSTTSPRWKRKYALLAAAAVLVLAAAGALYLRVTSSPVTVALSDSSGRIVLDRRGVLTGGDRWSAADREAVKGALASGTLAISPLVGALQGTSGTLMGAREAKVFALVAPVATAVVSQQPTCRWTPAAGARHYTVTIQDQHDGGTISSAEVQATEWTVDRPLARGRTYRWQVAASIGSTDIVAPAPPEPPAMFRVLDEATASRIGHSPDSHAVRAVLYAHAGLLDDAQRELDALAAINPDVTIVQDWIRQLGAARKQPSR